MTNDRDFNETKKLEIVKRNEDQAGRVEPLTNKLP